MDSLLILGTGPHAVEMADIVGRINQVQATWNLLGFVSPTNDKVGEERCGLPVFGSEKLWDLYPTALAIPEPEWPRKTWIPRIRLTSLIDPSSVVSTSAQIGLGCVIYPHCYVGANAHIGDFLFCLAGSVVNHENVIGDGVTITSSVTVAGNVYIEENCYLGQSCTIREMVRIGRGSLIGMGSVVLTDVAPNSVMVGNPARKLGARQHNLGSIQILKKARWLGHKAAKALWRRLRRLSKPVLTRVS